MNNSEETILRSRILDLEIKLARCEEAKERITRESEFLKTHPAIMQGLKGERLLCSLTGGLATSYAAKFDLLLGGTVEVEIKYSKLNTPMRGAPTRRWNWSKPLGIFDKGKKYDFLVLIGEKDYRFSEQYLDDAPYVFFLVPMKDVEQLMSAGKTIGGMIQINTNLRTARAGKSVLIKQYMIPMIEIEHMLSNIAV